MLASALQNLCPTRVAWAQAGAVAEISSPHDREVLRGTVSVRGTVHSEAFLAAELALGYTDDTTDTWFVLAQITQPIVAGELASWDTSLVSDGNYRLRARVSTLDGTYVDGFADIQVRNYTAPTPRTPALSPTSPPPMQIETPQSLTDVVEATAPVRPTPTRLPPNAGALTPTAILGGFWRGGFAVLAAGLIVIVVLLRRRS